MYFIILLCFFQKFHKFLCIFLHSTQLAPNRTLLLYNFKFQFYFTWNNNSLFSISNNDSISIFLSYLYVFRVEYYLFLLQLKAVFLNLVLFQLDEHFQVDRLLIKYIKYMSPYYIFPKFLQISLYLPHSNQQAPKSRRCMQTKEIVQGYCFVA